MNESKTDTEPTYFAALRDIAEQVRAAGNCGCTVVLADGTLATLSLDVKDPYAE